MSVIAGSHRGISPQETSEKCKSRHLEKEKKKTAIKNEEDTFKFNVHPEENNGFFNQEWENNFALQD